MYRFSQARCYIGTKNSQLIIRPYKNFLKRELKNVKALWEEEI